jgi:hypothetical protein
MRVPDLVQSISKLFLTAVLALFEALLTIFVSNGPLLAKRQRK